MCRNQFAYILYSEGKCLIEDSYRRYAYSF